jgi:hypothetical protein
VVTPPRRSFSSRSLAVFSPFVPLRTCIWVVAIAAALTSAVSNLSLYPHRKNLSSFASTLYPSTILYYLASRMVNSIASDLVKTLVILSL